MIFSQYYFYQLLQKKVFALIIGIDVTKTHYLKRVMLTSVSEVLVKDTKIRNFCNENSVIYIFKRSIAQVSILFYHIWFFN
jgi:hypothetical protein